MISDAHTGPGPIARLAAHLRARAVDRELIAGRAEHSSAMVSARALRLNSRRHRESLAGSIDRLIAAAGVPPSRVRIAPSGDAVLANASSLRALSSRLRAAPPITLRALASLTGLLTDGTGPVFQGDARALAAELKDIGASFAASATPTYGPVTARAAAPRLR
jgi:hypothetical protein